MASTLKQVMVHLAPETAEEIKRQAKEREMSVSAYVAYLVEAVRRHLVIIGDPTSVGYWKDLFLSDMLRSARVVAREEVKLYLHEQGFTTAPYEE